MKTVKIEKGVEIDVPVRVAYDQWTQFEDLPEILPNVHEVEQEDDRHVRWKVGAGERLYHWKAKICEQIPDRRIAWNAVAGFPNAGVVTFHRLDSERCKVMVQVDAQAETMAEALGDTFGLAESLVARNLEAFKEFIEKRGDATGGWRGVIERPEIADVDGDVEGPRTMS